MTTPVKLTAARYGKDKVRVLRVVKNGKYHEVAEYTVRALLEGDVETSYTQSDNSVVVATDSIKNTVYIKAKESKNVLQPESFALELGTHFVKTYAHIYKAFIDITQLKWSRIPIDGEPHPHSFQRDGDDKRIVSVEVDASQGKDKISAKVKSGIQDLLVLKSTGSAFENFVRDEYTTLPEVSDRIFSTSVDCSYDLVLPSTSLTVEGVSDLGVPFDAIYKSVVDTTLKIFAEDASASVQATLYKMCEKIIHDNKAVSDVTYRLPNQHYFAVDMSYYKGYKNTAVGDAEVYMPVSAPSGLITATVTRA